MLICKCSSSSGTEETFNQSIGTCNQKWYVQGCPLGWIVDVLKLSLFVAFFLLNRQKWPRWPLSEDILNSDAVSQKIGHNYICNEISKAIFKVDILCMIVNKKASFDISVLQKEKWKFLEQRISQMHLLPQNMKYFLPWPSNCN